MNFNLALPAGVDPQAFQQAIQSILDAGHTDLEWLMQNGPVLAAQSLSTTPIEDPSDLYFDKDSETPLLKQHAGNTLRDLNRRFGLQMKTVTHDGKEKKTLHQSDHPLVKVVKHAP